MMLGYEGSHYGGCVRKIEVALRVTTTSAFVICLEETKAKPSVNVRYGMQPQDVTDTSS